MTSAPLPGEDPASAWTYYERGELVEPWMGADGWRTYTFRCRRCGRDKPVREDKLMMIAAVLPKSGIDDGHPVLDISIIPLC